MAETKPCPYCGEPIQKVAQKCKWCGEWLNEDNHPSKNSYITCPTCGEQIPEGSKTCPLCKEPVSSIPPRQVSKSSPRKIRPVYLIAGGLAVAALLIVGGFKFVSYQNEQEYQEKLENSPYSIISKNLEEAITKGQGLNVFLRDEKNVDALKSHFGEEQYSLMLALSFYSDEPLISWDSKTNAAGGCAWRTESDKNRYGCQLYLTNDALGCRYLYDGLEVDQYGQIVRNNHWDCGYYKDDFNEDDTEKPYIEQWFEVNEHSDKRLRIRIDKIWGISFNFSDLYYFDQINLRNNDTGEVWTLPIRNLNGTEAVLLEEGAEKFSNWFHTANSLKLSAIDSSGQYSPNTITISKDQMSFRESFMAHVMKIRISDSIFVKNGFN